MMEVPTFTDVMAAQEFIGQCLAPTPLVHCRRLSRLVGCDYYATCENLQPVGAFKVCGGVNLAGQLDAESRAGSSVPVPATTASH